MKKTLALVALAGLMLTSCSGGEQASTTPTAAAVAVATADSISVPDVVGMRLDKATDQIEGLGLKVQAKDPENGKTVVVKSNWEVTAQDPGKLIPIAKGSLVKLEVRHLTEASPTPTPTPPSEPAQFVAPVAPPVVADPPAVVAPAAPAPKAPPVAPAAPAPKAPPAAPAPPAPGGGTIICKDGYVWPSATRQGACSRHGGISK